MEQAEAKGISGHVRNLADGRVEAVFEGEPDSVAELVSWCRRGPRAASVAHLSEVDETPTGEVGFRMLL